MSAVLTPPPPVLTREEYHALGDAGYFGQRRVELIRGVVRDHPAQTWPDTLARYKTVRLLEIAFAGLGWLSQRNPLPVGNSEPEPDVAVIPGELRDYTDHPTTALLVVEIADLSLEFDLTTKAELFATAGVPDYWVLDVNARQLIVFRDPAPTPAAGHTYQTLTTFAPADRVSPLAAPAASLLVADLLP